jgi:peptide/nickel transport system permease protein
MATLSLRMTPRPSRLATAAVAISRHPSIAVGLALLLVILAAGYLLPLPYDPRQPFPRDALLPPGGDHPFGTDRDGFDVFSRTIEAATRDLPLALAGTLASLAVGVPLGLLASKKGRSSELLMRALDVFQSFPLVVIAVALVTLTGNRLENVIFAIMIINVPRLIRLVRSEALALRESRFVEAAWAMGASPWRVLRRHILPNVTGITLAQASLGAAQAIAVIAALSFLGVGVSPPDPTWGSMVQEGARNMTTGQWWVVVFPGIAIFVTIASLNLVADGLQSLYDRDSR